MSDEKSVTSYGVTLRNDGSDVVVETSSFTGAPDELRYRGETAAALAAAAETAESGAVLTVDEHDAVADTPGNYVDGDITLNTSDADELTGVPTVEATALGVVAEAAIEYEESDDLPSFRAFQMQRVVGRVGGTRDLVIYEDGDGDYWFGVAQRGETPDDAALVCDGSEAADVRDALQ